MTHTELQDLDVVPDAGSNHDLQLLDIVFTYLRALFTRPPICTYHNK
jgi:hypothetical protein